MFKKFDNIDIDYIYTDKHIHSIWAEGKATIPEIANKAQEIGLRQIALTEHVRADSTYFAEYLHQINKIKRECQTEILTGFEAKIINFQGDIDVSNEVLKKAEIRIASVHRFPIGRRLYYPQQLEKQICQEAELELSVAAIKKRKCNVLGHAGGMSLRTYNEFPLSFFEEIISECKKNGVAFDLNSVYHRSIFQDLKVILRKYNSFVSLGSDAHSIDELGGWIDIFQEEKDR